MGTNQPSRLSKVAQNAIDFLDTEWLVWSVNQKSNNILISYFPFFLVSRSPNPQILDVGSTGRVMVWSPGATNQGPALASL